MGKSTKSQNVLACFLGGTGNIPRCVEAYSGLLALGGDWLAFGWSWIGWQRVAEVDWAAAEPEMDSLERR